MSHCGLTVETEDSLCLLEFLQAQSLVLASVLPSSEGKPGTASSPLCDVMSRLCYCFRKGHEPHCFSCHAHGPSKQTQREGGAGSHGTEVHSRTPGLSSASAQNLQSPEDQALGRGPPLENRHFHCPFLFRECVHQSSFSSSPECTDISQPSLQLTGVT